MVKQSPVEVGTDVTLQCNADNPASFNSNPGISWYFASNNSKITRNVETGTCNSQKIVLLYFSQKQLPGKMKLRTHRVRGLHFLAVIFAAIIKEQRMLKRILVIHIMLP